MTILKATVAAAFLSATAAANVSACTVTALHVTGDGNFTGVESGKCAYTSLDVNASYSFADIINIFGAMVTGIYGNGHHYQVKNRGNNELAIYVNGRWISTRVDVRGDNNDVYVEQTAPGSSLDLVIRGDDSDFKVVMH